MIPTSLTEKVPSDSVKPKSGSNGSDSESAEDSGVVYFYGQVNSSSVLTLQKDLHKAARLQKEWDPACVLGGRSEGGKVTPVWLRINSQGGYVTDGLLASDFIERLSKVVPVSTIVDGMAASAATMLSVVGATRYITPRSFMMIHELRGWLEGPHSKLVEDVDNCKQLMKVITDLYVGRTKMSRAEVKALLKKDRYLPARECLKLGLVDEILD